MDEVSSVVRDSLSFKDIKSTESIESFDLVM